RDGPSPTTPDGARPFDQRKPKTSEPLELLGVVLTRRNLQCLDGSATQHGRLVFFPFGIEFRHDSRLRNHSVVFKQPLAPVIGGSCGSDIKTLRKFDGCPTSVNLFFGVFRDTVRRKLERLKGCQTWETPSPPAGVRSGSLFDTLSPRDLANPAGV